MALPPPPKQRRKIDSLQQKGRDKDRERTEMRKRRQIQILKEHALLKDEPAEVAAEARAIASKERVTLKDALHLARQRHRWRYDTSLNGSTTATSSMIIIRPRATGSNDPW